MSVSEIAALIRCHGSWTIHVFCRSQPRSPSRQSVIAIGPSTDSIISAIDISLAGRDNINPPLTPRWESNISFFASSFSNLLFVGNGIQVDSATPAAE